MVGLIKQLVTGVVESVLKEILKKAGGAGSTKRQKRQARSSTTGRFKKAVTVKAKPAKKQLSRRKTAASRSKLR